MIKSGQSACICANALSTDSVEKILPTPKLVRTSSTSRRTNWLSSITMMFSCEKSAFVIVMRALYAGRGFVMTSGADAADAFHHDGVTAIAARRHGCHL